MKNIWQKLLRTLSSLWSALSSEKAARFATVMQLLVVPLSFYFIWSQLEQQANLVRAANSQALANTIIPMNMELARNNELTDLMYRVSRDFRPPLKREVEEDRYQTVIASYLIFYENVHLQHRKGLLDPDLYLGWERDLRNFVRDDGFNEYWKSARGSYRQDFAELVDRLLAEK